MLSPQNTTAESVVEHSVCLMVTRKQTEREKGRGQDIIPYVHGFRDVHWNNGNSPWATLLEKIGSSSISSHQWPVVSQRGVEPHEPLLCENLIHLLYILVCMLDHLLEEKIPWQINT